MRLLNKAVASAHGLVPLYACECDGDGYDFRCFPPKAMFWHPAANEYLCEDCWEAVGWPDEQLDFREVKPMSLAVALEMDVREGCGPKIKTARKSMGWSLQFLGRLADVSAPFLHDIENGRRFPSERTLLKIEDVFLPRRKIQDDNPRSGEAK